MARVPREISFYAHDAKWNTTPLMPPLIPQICVTRKSYYRNHRYGLRKTLPIFPEIVVYHVPQQTPIFCRRLTFYPRDPILQVVLKMDPLHCVYDDEVPDLVDLVEGTVRHPSPICLPLLDRILVEDCGKLPLQFVNAVQQFSDLIQKYPVTCRKWWD